MSVIHIQSFAYMGIDAIPVDIQVQITSGLPAFIIVGLADKTVAEARERVRSALTALGLSLPAKRITVNMAPADLQKEGSHFDLPIALGILAAMGVIPQNSLVSYAALGEVSLDGQIHAVTGVLSAAIQASSMEMGLICPAAQGSEALLGGDINILAPYSLIALINHFKGLQILAAPQLSAPTPPPQLKNLADVKGMESAKRALEIAASGGHSLLMVGPPGTGKSMLAARLADILPDLTPQQSLETSRIHSMAGLLEKGAPIRRSPFRDPHHSASPTALVGGGTKAKPGEISLAHNGVLFLDEFPEFPRQSLESLRQPLETGYMSIARVAAHIRYPARFQLIAAMNPCRCGHLGTIARECTKAPQCGGEYMKRLSGPLLDRIDMIVHVQPVTPREMSTLPTGEDSAVIAKRVAQARSLQHVRFQNASVNAEADIETFALSQDTRHFLEKAAHNLHLSGRSFTRLVRVARTIADMHAQTDIQSTHIAEALGYRHRENVHSVL